LKNPATGRTRSPTSKNSTADYVAIGIAYAEDAVADKKRTRYGRKIRKAARRFLRDLKRAQGKRPPFVWSPGQANRACAFLERLPHVEGQWPTPTITLHPAQIFFVVQLFGFRNHDGGRRFTSAIYAIARKNAKSTLAAGILLYCLCYENEVGPQVVSAATTGAQAWIVFNIARRMAERTEDLREAMALEVFARSIVSYDNGGMFRPINAKASTQDGLNPSHAGLDEIHAHKTHDLLNVLRSAAGARRNPLFLYTTTEGYENPGPWAELRTFSDRVLDNVIDAEHFLIVFYAVDDDDGDFDESAYIKANPLIDVNPILLTEIRKEAIEARAMPGRLAEFRIKRLNRRAASASAWVNLTRWRKCDGAVPLDELVGAPCWGAFDLASTRDLTAWRLLWLKDGVFYTWGRQWVPDEGVTQRTERGTAPYAAWVESGYVERTEGNATDYGIVEARILEDCARFSPQLIGFDEWNAGYLVNRLIDAGMPLEKFVQGTRSYNPAMKACEHAYMTGRLRHGGDPVLQWCAANLVPTTDANLNMKPDKKRSADKIDAMTALLMCFGLAEATEGGDVAGFLANPIIA
jgi:phage terminase large subunit-like protein